MHARMHTQALCEWVAICSPNVLSVLASLSAGITLSSVPSRLLLNTTSNGECVFIRTYVHSIEYRFTLTVYNYSSGVRMFVMIMTLCLFRWGYCCILVTHTLPQTLSLFLSLFLSLSLSHAGQGWWSQRYVFWSVNWSSTMELNLLMSIPPPMALLLERSTYIYKHWSLYCNTPPLSFLSPSPPLHFFFLHMWLLNWVLVPLVSFVKKRGVSFTHNLTLLINIRC